MMIIIIFQMRAREIVTKADNEVFNKITWRLVGQSNPVLK